ncbi:MAG: thioredoxin domain-containing protein [Gammaproteobacteria bacterium]|nr:thioredoxin domain-containing protein [Gammaproteobacteria bacterium]
MKKNMIIVATAILFVVLFIVAASVYNKQKDKEQSSASLEKTEYLQRDYSPRMGPPDARVTIVEFFDPACGTCSAFYPFVKQLMNDNPAKVNLVLRYLPLHQNSDVIVSIFEAARLQNRFWETLERAYQTREAWIEHHVSRPEKFWQQLGGLGLDMQKLNEDMQSPEIARRVRQDMQDAQQLKVSKTPGFFVNAKPLLQFGYQPLQQLVESEVAANY